MKKVVFLLAGTAVIGLAVACKKDGGAAEQTRCWTCVTTSVTTLFPNAEPETRRTTQQLCGTLATKEFFEQLANVKTELTTKSAVCE